MRIKYYREVEYLDHVGGEKGRHHIVNGADIVSKRGEVRRGGDVGSKYKTEKGLRIIRLMITCT